MQPGYSDPQTWRDCVLVFVARLKWPTTVNLDDGISAVVDKKEKRVAGFELGFNEKLAPKFTGMQPRLGRGCQQACDHIHTIGSEGEQSFVRDMWTLESSSGDPLPEIVRVEGDTTVIKCMDVEITLPSSMVPTVASRLAVNVQPSSVTIVHPNGRLLTMPRDNPTLQTWIHPFSGLPSNIRKWRGPLFQGSL